MLLSARPLNSVNDVNHFDTVTVLEMTQGDTSDIYLQLVDVSVDKSFDPSGRRYMPLAGATLQVTIQDIDSGTTIVASATQPFANDTSIWRVTHNVGAGVDLSALIGTYALKLKLTEGPNVKYGFVSQALSYRRNTPEFEG